MSHAAPSTPTNASHLEINGNRTPRARADSETTSNILQYYTSTDEPEAYSAAELAHIRSQAAKRPPTEPATRHESPKDSSNRPRSSSSSVKHTSSIRLVPTTSHATSSSDVFRRPALHHADSVHIVVDNRRMAIVEREGASPGSNAGFPVSTTSNGNPSGRTVESSQLTLVAPPDADLTSYNHFPPVTAADFALGKSSKVQNMGHQTKPLISKRLPELNNQTSNEPIHSRTSSESTTREFPQSRSPLSTELPTRTSLPVSQDGNIPVSPRTSEEDYAGHRHRHKKQVSSGSGGQMISKYSEESEAPRAFSASSPMSSDHTPAKRLFSKNKGESFAHDGLHIPLPNRPHNFASSTGILTPNIGDSKPIDRKVAAPVFVDIRSDLADLWLAATPDRDTEGLPNVIGSPITTSTTTDSNSQSNSLSPSSSHQSPMTSPTYSTSRYDHANDTTTGTMPSPPRRINVHALSVTSSPVCPPRPQRQPSPSKPSSRRSSREGIRTNSRVSLRDEDKTKEHETTSSSNRGLTLKHADPEDSKYALASVSDDESASEYSTNTRDRKGTTSSSRKGSIHLREGAFPSHSVFLHRLQTETQPDPSEADLKTPTGREKEPTILHFPEFDRKHGNNDDRSQPVAHSLKLGDHAVRLNRSPSNASSGRRSEDISQGRRSSVSDSIDGENAVLMRSSSLRPKVPSKDRQPEGIEPPPPHSPTFIDESATKSRLHLHSQLGYGLPPSEKGRNGNVPSSFKAKGPLATSGTIRTQISRRTYRKPPSMWPSAMSFADVLAEQTPLARARGYAMKINELATEECGLRDWIESLISKTRTVIMTDSGPVPVGQAHPRLVSGSSAQSEMTFPIRVDAYKAMDLTPINGEISSTEVPSSIPYPTLALRQQHTGSRSIISSAPSAKSTTSSTSKSGPSGFLATLSRKTSMRTRGTQSATEGREKESKTTPRKLVSSRSLAARSTGSGGSTPPSSTPITISAPLPAVAPSLPGGPRPPRPKRASTMMISAPIPIISAPIPIPPASAHPDTVAFSNYSDYQNTSHSMVAQPLLISREPPKAPEGPRAQAPRLARTPSFPGPVRVSSNGNIRSTASFKPSTTPLSTAMTGQSNTSGSSHARERPSLEEANLNMLCDVMPHVPRDTLALYLRRANGQNLVAIGRYLEDERNGTVARV
ncbi:hypothetical protein FRC16_006082 [Serendipita sp. 398]|nr:hypothetical protein FRC16_006082 [Serendipita sp. 398]